MIGIESRKDYDCVTILRGAEQVAKVYIRHNGLISNLYVRKKYRGNLSILDELAMAINKYQARPLYGYASPKQGVEKREALKRLYRRYGFKNIKGNKIVKA